MGSIWLHSTAKPITHYLDKWGVRYKLHDGWQRRSRGSGGFESVMGIQVHHSAGTISQTLESATRWCTESSADRPIGNGTFTRDNHGPILLLWASGAANTAGKGGPRLTSRGTIPLDAANSRTVAFEAENNGIGEPWSDSMIQLMILTHCAVLDWANNETPGADLGVGDIFGHFEWTTRKIDPWGPSLVTAGVNRQWDMNRYRGMVWARLVAGSPGTPAPVPGTPPLAPAAATLKVAGSGKMTLSWTPPTSDGGQPVTEYATQYATRAAPDSWIGEAKHAANVRSRTISVSNNTEYRARVLCFNVKGGSAWKTTGWVRSYVPPPPTPPPVTPPPPPAVPEEQQLATGPKMRDAPSAPLDQSEAKWYHTILNQNGWRDVRGWFSSGTRDTLKVFQERNALIVDGKYNHATATALQRVWASTPWPKTLSSVPPAGANIEFGKGGAPVEWLHQALIEAGYMDVFGFLGGGTAVQTLVMERFLVSVKRLSSADGTYNSSTEVALSGYLKSTG